ncbi:flagellar hook-length control protein FliK [Luteimonas saliphila]|uniref:flagellar hook-length control protein FliK n=1 Tax=Luteimonas saliphila TaxID=2804919 RepID=UPI00192DC00D|nr:flagellar hook-length control protein FliK [Luteimonas saliphila]
MNGAGPSPLVAGSAGLASAGRGAPRLDGGDPPRSPAPAQRPAARGDRGHAVDPNPARPHEPATDLAPGDRPFAELLVPAPPAASPAAAPEAADRGEDSDETSPQHLLALLDGQWFGVRTAAVAADGAPPVSVPAPAAQQPLDMPAGASVSITTVPELPTLDGAPPSAPGTASGTSPAATGANAATIAAEGAVVADARLRPATDVAAAASSLLPATAEAGTTKRDAGIGADPGFAIEAPTAGVAGATPPSGARSPTTATLPPLPMPAHPDAGFDDGFGQRIAWMADQRIGHAEIRLNPEQVGPIDVRVQLDGDQVRAEFHSAHAEVRQAIEASLPRLRELLGQHGLQLGQADVGQRQAGQDGSTPRRDAAAGAGGDARAGEDAPQSAQTHLRLRGLLDEYA